MLSKVILIRHGIAQSIWVAGSDDARELTHAGRESLLAAYPEFLADGSIDPSDVTILASRATRTRQTAGIVAQILGVPEDSVVIASSLSHNASPQPILQDILACDSGTVIAVGHNPSIEDAASCLQGRMRGMSCGEAVCYDVTGRRDRASVLWDCRPR